MYAESLSKVCRCYVVTFLNWTSRFGWYVVRWGSKSKHRKDTCLKESGLRLQILITTLHSIPNTVGRTSVSSSQSNRHALPIIITNAKVVHFLIRYLHMFHHKIANATLNIFGVNLISRSWRTWKINQKTPTYLTFSQLPKCGFLIDWTPEHLTTHTWRRESAITGIDH